MKHKAFRWIPAVLLAALLAGCGAETAPVVPCPGLCLRRRFHPGRPPGQKKPGADGAAHRTDCGRTQPCRKTGSSRC